MSRRTAVVGGGLAGITAALRLADAGQDVVLFENKPWLGGLTYSFNRGGLDVDNGQHVFLRCCSAYRALLDRLGVADQVHLQDRLDIPVRAPGQPPARLRRNDLPAPLHLGAALLGYRLISPAQRMRFIAAALGMRRLDRTDPAVDARSFGDWLRDNGQDRRTVEAMWDLVGLATLNVTADHASLALAAMVFQVGLLTDATAADIGWATVPLRQLHGDAAAKALETAGVTVHTGTKVDAIDRQDDGRWLVRSREEERMVDQVVLAVPPAAAERLAPADAVAPGTAARLGSSPIVNAHVVLDRRVMAEPYVAGVGTPIQWVFDRTAQSGLSGTGQYLAVSVSAADDLIDTPVAEVRNRLLPELIALFPELADATVTDFFVTRERDATFRGAPGTASARPPSVTGVAGLFLAGAWTDTGWPATMEGAVRSGDSAAHAVLTSSETSEGTGAPAAPSPSDIPGAGSAPPRPPSGGRTAPNARPGDGGTGTDGVDHAAGGGRANHTAGGGRANHTAGGGRDGEGVPA